MSPYEIIIKPHITEKSVNMSYGDAEAPDEKNVRTYTFVVAKTANKLQIKDAIEKLYNANAKKGDDKITVTRVAVINVKGHMRRVGQRSSGLTTGFKKAYVTLGPGQVLEDFGV